MKKIINIGLLAGLLILAASMVWGMLSNMIWPQLAKDYQNPQIFRPWSDPAMSIFFVHPFIVGVILAWIWSKTDQLFNNPIRWKRGVIFGFTYWVVTIPGMIISYSTFQVSLIMILSWTMNGLIQAVVAGYVFSKLLYPAKNV
ncbi:MAG: hypothetical protein HY015_05945 [Bacteroidetes bacterium]|nr:hypothetical protein [Bacteroidota bacterium]MBI3482504.1 hypothetical protein [Bacteroidota bacterium]